MLDLPWGPFSIRDRESMSDPFFGDSGHGNRVNPCHKCGLSNHVFSLGGFAGRVDAKPAVAAVKPEPIEGARKKQGRNADKQLVPGEERSQSESSSRRRCA
jgi:hypothetical protein